MITKFHIENFKSLYNFDLPPNGHYLGSFTCLIGLNGSGKSTLLQAFDFMAQIANGNIGAWIAGREWKKNELVSNLGKKKPVINFKIGIKTPSGAEITWEGRFNNNLLKCTTESVIANGKLVLKLEDGVLFVAGAKDSDDTNFKNVPFEYQGAVFSQLKVNADPAIGELKSEMQGLCSLELLSPQLMHRKARASKNDIGKSGENLSPFLDQLTGESKKKLQDMLQGFYPQLASWNVKTYRFGWKGLRIQESFKESATVEPGHINDGFLRVIAILAQAHSNHRFLLFDEIENGINPSLVERLMDFLVGLGAQGKQVIVTTHSPMILNFLTDDVARENVLLLYKTDDGKTQSCRYFDQPETGYKLKALGPGEVFIDTDLTKLVARLSAQNTNVFSGKAE